MSNQIERLIQQGKFLSRSEFGLKAATTLLDLIDNETHYLRVLTEYMFHLHLFIDNPANIIPDEVSRGLRRLYGELLHDEKLVE